MRWSEKMRGVKEVKWSSASLSTRLIARLYIVQRKQ